MSVSNENLLVMNTKSLILGRLGLIFLLLLATWWWTNVYLDWSIDSFPNRLFLLFLVSVALSLVYFLLFNLNREYLWQIRIQFLIDTFLITWLVGETGDFVSPYITLYIVLISVAGYFLGKRETLFVSILSAVCFAVLSILSSQSLIYSLSGAVPPSRFVQIIAFNSVGILIVGLLAARLSDRRKVSQTLKETEESFEDLNVLHKRIVESIRSGLITTDLAGRIRTFNKTAETILGRTADETIGESLYSLFAENIRPAVDLCLFRASEGQSFPTEHFESFVRSQSDGNGDSPVASVAGSVAPFIG
jgi:two-component system sensor histidine kinase PilS (NtrC family)